MADVSWGCALRRIGANSGRFQAHFLVERMTSGVGAAESLEGVLLGSRLADQRRKCCARQVLELQPPLVHKSHSSMPPRPYGDAKPQKQVGRAGPAGEGGGLSRTPGVLRSQHTNCCVPSASYNLCSHIFHMVPLPVSAPHVTSVTVTGVTVRLPAVCLSPPGTLCFLPCCPAPGVPGCGDRQART